MARSQGGALRRSTAKRLSPLWIVSLFVSLTETIAGVGIIQTTGSVQVTLTVFVVGFPILVASGFFLILWDRPWVFYSPGEYGNVDPAKYVSALRHARYTKINIQQNELEQGRIETAYVDETFIDRSH
jgi:hypothetical protein